MECLLDRSFSLKQQVLKASVILGALLELL
jgi:hypothetical protein